MSPPKHCQERLLNISCSYVSCTRAVCMSSSVICVLFICMWILHLVNRKATVINIPYPFPLLCNAFRSSSHVTWVHLYECLSPSKPLRQWLTMYLNVKLLSTVLKGIVFPNPIPATSSSPTLPSYRYIGQYFSYVSSRLFINVSNHVVQWQCHARFMVGTSLKNVLNFRGHLKSSLKLGLQKVLVPWNLVATNKLLLLCLVYTISLPWKIKGCC